jgi:hypothetical protein
MVVNPPVVTMGSIQSNGSSQAILPQGGSPWVWHLKGPVGVPGSSCERNEGSKVQRLC